MSHVEHKQKAPRTARCAVITLSDTRTRENDTSGRYILDSLQAAGHELVGYELIPDDPMRLKGLIVAAFDDPRIEVLITNGGTGISRRDGTVEIVESFLHKRLDGFGEIFRSLSYAEIGSSAIMSRAVAGIDVKGRVLIALPGSTNAVRLAMEKLVLPELGHLLQQARR